MTDREQARAKLLEGLAKKHFDVETLETRKMDDLDFYDVAIWSIKAALNEAFEVGNSFKEI